MEPPPRPQEINKNNPSPMNSPRTTTTVALNGGSNLQIPITRSDQTNNNPCPTTFVQADTTNFKQVVQMLTGSSETASKPAAAAAAASPSSSPSPDPLLPPSPNNQNINTKSFVIPPMKTTTPKKQSFKLYERRSSSFKNSLIINTLLPSFATNQNQNHNNNYNCTSCEFSPRNNNNLEILSPSMLDFPKLALNSPVTPLNSEDPFNKSSSSLGFSSYSSSSSEEEERAIAEKGFYLHPSPIPTPGDNQPQLLPLFPVTSPRVSGSSSS